MFQQSVRGSWVIFFVLLSDFAQEKGKRAPAGAALLHCAQFSGQWKRCGVTSDSPIWSEMSSKDG